MSHNILTPSLSLCRLLSAQALLSQLEHQATAVANASADASTRRQKLEQQQEELKKNLKVRSWLEPCASTISTPKKGGGCGCS
jgi:hypothetical protein